MSRIVFVSGGSGFIGRAVVRELLKRQYRVHALVHRRPLPIDDGRISTFAGELDDRAVLDAAMERCSAAIHLVGIIREDRPRNVTFHRMHVDFTRTVVDACVRHGVMRYIHMSALGARADSPSLYHQTKAAAEAIVESSGLSWTIFRPSLVHGPEGEFSQMLLDWARRRKAPWLFMPYFGAGLLGTGRKYLVQPVLVDDLARMIVDAIDLPVTIGKRYDVGGIQHLTWPEMYHLFSREVVGRRRLALPIPAWYALLLTRILPPALLPFNRAQVIMSQEDSVADIEPIRRDFNFRPAGFSESLSRYARQLR